MLEDRRVNNGNRTRLEEMVTEIHTRVERMDARLFDETDGFVTRTKDSIKDHQERIEKVENFRWYLIGLGAALIIAKDFVVHKVFKQP